MQLPTPGQWFQRRYELGELLGKGGFAAVFRAVDHDVGREVAIKILMPDHNGYEPGLVQRFMREGRIVAGLQDPHTITMYDFGRTEDDLLFMVFEYVTGSDLSKLLLRTGPMPERDVMHILQQLLSALREAHNAGILHRDIKPANVFIHSYMDDDRRVKLLDFGIAKPTMQEGEVDELEESTKSGMSPGTPRYMSPEQIYGDELTPASDIFSLGLVAYEMLSGKPAVQGRTTKETLLHQLSDKPIELPPFLRVSPELREMVNRMTRKRPSERFQSVQEMLNHLATVSSIAMSRPLPPARDLTKRERAHTDPPLLSPLAKERLTMVGLVALAVLVGAALIIPLGKLVESALDREPPLPPMQPAVNPVATAELGPAAREPERFEADIGVDDEPSAPTTNCGGEPPFVGTSEAVTRLGVLDKRYLLTVPKKYDPDHPYPIVLLFHDQRDRQTTLADSRLDQVAEEHGFIIVAPRGGKGDNPWSRTADLSTIRAIVEDVTSKWCVDTSRLFAVAHGRAGRMAEELPCEMQLSGVATSSFLPILKQETLCKPKRPTPIIHFMGMGNQYTPAGGAGKCSGAATISIDRREQLALERNDCEGPNISWNDHEHGACFTRACPEAPFVSCRLDGSYEFVSTTVFGFVNPCESKPTRFNVAGNIWRFFADHGIPLETPQ